MSALEISTLEALAMPKNGGAAPTQEVLELRDQRLEVAALSREARGAQVEHEVTR